MLTHKSLLATVHFLDHFEFNATENDVLLSYLPLAHAFEQCVFLITMTRGAANGYFSGNPALLAEDLQALRPTFFCTVPRILNRFYDKIYESVNSKGGIKKWLFDKAVESKLHYL